MAVAFVQGNNAYNSSVAGLTSICAFSSNNTSGNCLVVDVFLQELFSGFGTYTVSDSAGNTWHTAVNSENTGNGFFGTFYALNCAAGANTVKVNYTGSGGKCLMAVHEYSGVVLTSAQDAINQQFQTSRTNGQTLVPTLSTSAAGDLLHVATGGSGNSGDASAIANSLSWTQREFAASGATNSPFIASWDGVGGGAGSVTNTLTYSAGATLSDVAANLLALFATAPAGGLLVNRGMDGGMRPQFKGGMNGKAQHSSRFDLEDGRDLRSEFERHHRRGAYRIGLQHQRPDGVLLARRGGLYGTNYPGHDDAGHLGDRRAHSR